MNLDQHLHNPVAALQVVQSSLQDDYVRVGHVIALVERAQKLKTTEKLNEFDFDELLDPFNFMKAKEVGRALFFSFSRI